MRITEDQVKKAMQTIYKWAKQNKVRYVDYAFFTDRTPTLLCLTYQKINSKEYQDIIIEKGGKHNEN